MTTLGERVRETRIRYGMSQAELSRRVRISKNAMNSIERGRTPDPSVSVIAGIADALHVSTDFLIGRTGKGKAKSGASEHTGETVGSAA